MQRSTGRILTTHAGSLPRPDDVVKQQVEHSLDIVDDGAMAGPSLVTYATQRLGGFDVYEEPSTVATSAGSTEIRPSIARAKPGTPRQGARSAGRQRWGAA